MKPKGPNIRVSLSLVERAKALIPRLAGRLSATGRRASVSGVVEMMAEEGIQREESKAKPPNS